MSDIAVRSAREAVSKGSLTEDWLALAVGVLVFALSLFSLGGIDLLGWAVTTSVYTDVATALAPVAKSLFGFVIWVGLLISWLFFSGFKPPLAS
jgi:hypothetical protein